MLTPTDTIRLSASPTFVHLLELGVMRPQGGADQVGILLEAVTPASTPRGTPLGPHSPGSKVGRVVILPFLPTPVCVFIATQQTLVESLHSGARLQVPCKACDAAWQVSTLDTSNARQHATESSALTPDVTGSASLQQKHPIDMAMCVQALVDNSLFTIRRGLGGQRQASRRCISPHDQSVKLGCKRWSECSLKVLHANTAYPLRM